MLNMEDKMNDIYWHDSVINRVVETPSTSELVMEVDYPVDWENNIFEPRSIVFTDYLDYHIQEGPFVGNPTIIEATIEHASGSYYRIVLETNAGRRSLRFRNLEIRKSLISSQGAS